jgi:hypothetical protein
MPDSRGQANTRTPKTDWTSRLQPVAELNILLCNIEGPAKSCAGAEKSEEDSQRFDLVKSRQSDQIAAVRFQIRTTSIHGKAVGCRP